MMYGENLKLSIVSIMGALAAERQWMKLVMNERKPYNKLIDYLLSEWTWKTGAPRNSGRIDTVKHYADSLGEKPSTVNKWLRQIYQDIFDLNEEHPELFVNADEHMCSFEYSPPRLDGGFWFNLGLKSVPRVGDLFSFRFVRPLTDQYDFVVKEVTHRFENGKMEIEISLKEKYYEGDSYRNLLIAKARFLGYMDILDASGPDYAVDEKLRKIFLRNENGYI